MHKLKGLQNNGIKPQQKEILSKQRVVLARDVRGADARLVCPGRMEAGKRAADDTVGEEHLTG